MPIVVVALALVAAISIGVIAWELSSDEFHKSFEGEPGRPDEAPRESSTEQD